MALIVPPLPAASRPSNTTITRSPFSRIQSWSAHSSTCRVRSSLLYSWSFIGLSAVFIGLVSSSSRVRIPASPRTEYAKVQFFRLHPEEEQEAREQKPRPGLQRHRFGVEQRLQRGRVSEQRLQDHDREDAQRQVRVAEMRPERQRGVDQVATVEQVEDLTDGNGIDRDRPGEGVRCALRLHPEERPQRVGEQSHADEEDAPDAQASQARPFNRTPPPPPN